MNDKLICMTRLAIETHFFTELVRKQDASHEPVDGTLIQLNVTVLKESFIPAAIQVFECKHCHCLIPV